ncbi:MAG: transcription-repair coupling factor, partial [Desulfovibrio sp.]|nr:transcription-repair coupling factor [Desulfovibrio sp.]
MATLARLACEAHFQGRSAVILTHGREDFLMARALLTLFLSGAASESSPAGKPVWKDPVLALPPMRHGMFREAWGQRLATLYTLASGGARCLVASVESLLLRYVPQNFFATRHLVLQRGTEFSSELILEQAAEWGYERVPLVTRPGDVARRGDILDIYPAGYAGPVRLEFFGDAIEDMRLFDGETQLSSASIDELVMLPVIPLTLEGGGREAAAARCEKLRHEGRISENDCYSLKKCLEGGGVGLLPGTVHEATTLLEDWLPPDTLWLLPGEADSADALRDGGHALKAMLEE